MPFGLIGETEIQRLVPEGASESAQLEFKRTLYKFPPSATQKPATELNEAFCKDVTAIANGTGGVIICGVAAKNGIASAVPGVSASDIDGEKLWAESVLANQVSPRLASVQMRDIDVAGTKVALIGIPRSLGRPHGFTTGSGTPLQFWKRNNAGNQPMDINDLRDQFGEAREWARQIEEFRKERIKKLRTKSGTVTLSTGSGILMMWVLPLGTPRTSVDLPSIDSQWLNHLYWGGGNPMVARPNADGWIVTSGTPPQVKHAQIFRAGGGIEIRQDLAAVMLRPRPSAGGSILDGTQVEYMIAKTTKRALDWFNTAGIDGPFVVSVALIGVEGVVFEAPGIHTGLDGNYAIDEHQVELSDQILESASPTAVDMMGGLFDELWQSASWVRSPLWRADGTCSYSTALAGVTWAGGAA